MNRPWAYSAWILIIFLLTVYLASNLYAEETVVSDLPEQIAVDDKTDPIAKDDEPEQLEGVSDKDTDSLSESLSAEDLEYLKSQISNDILEQIRESVKKEIRNEMRLEDENWLDRMHLSVPEWTKKIRLFGDFRFRYEGVFYNDDNSLLLDPQDTSYLLNTREQQDRYRMRARIGLSAEINKQVDLTFRLSTGSSGSPVSTNETLGDYFNKDSILFDRAYVKLLPLAFKPQYAFYMGRFSSPYEGTDLVFDSDLGFEGLSFVLDTRKTGTFNSIMVLGAYPLQEEEWYNDKWLFGGQLGFEYNPRRDLSFGLAAAYYHYENIEGEVNSTEYPELNNWTSPLYQQKGNTLINIASDSSGEFTPGLASKFHLANVTAYVDCAVYYPIRIRLTLDAVENFGFDTDELIERTGVDDIQKDTTGYQLELMVGHSKVKNFGEWQGAFTYKYVGADAVLDAFTDSDFHMGGTNAQGWILKMEFGIMKNMWLTTRWLTSDEIHGPQLMIDQLQADLSVSF